MDPNNYKSQQNSGYDLLFYYTLVMYLLIVIAILITLYGYFTGKTNGLLALIFLFPSAIGVFLFNKIALASLIARDKSIENNDMLNNLSKNYFRQNINNDQPK